MKNITITIGTATYSVSEQVASAITMALQMQGITPKSTSQPKATTTSPKGKGKKQADTTSPKVLKVDKYGNKWIAPYDAAKYATKKAEMITNGTYDPKNRSKVYKELGWIL